MANGADSLNYRLPNPAGSDYRTNYDRTFMKRVRMVTIECQCGNATETTLVEISAEAEISVTAAETGRVFDVWIKGPTEDVSARGVKRLIVGKPQEVG